jgi:predicted esterase
MSQDVSTFKYRFQPGPDPIKSSTLLLLHGTGGNENDLLPLGSALAPQANLLSPRGQELEEGMPRFFRRFAEGVFDQENLRARTDELATFIRQSAEQHHIDVQRVIAVGYSNGANIAGSLLLRHPHLLQAAILFRPMVPFRPEIMPDLSAVKLFLAAGRQDPIVPTQETEHCATLFEEAGAQVTLTWFPQGHNLSYQEIESAQQWLSTQNLLRS